MSTSLNMLAAKYPLGLAVKPARPSRTRKHEEKTDTYEIKPDPA